MKKIYTVNNAIDNAIYRLHFNENDIYQVFRNRALSLQHTIILHAERGRHYEVYQLNLRHLPGVCATWSLSGGVGQVCVDASMLRGALSRCLTLLSRITLDKES